MINAIKEILIRVNITDVVKKVANGYDDNSTIEGIKKNINKLEKNIELLKNSLDNIYIDKATKKISEEMYNRVEKKINCDIETKEKKLAKSKKHLKELKSSKTASKNLNKVVEDILSLEKPDRNLMLRLIEKIDVHEDGIADIYFNFKELNIIKGNYIT